MQALGGKEQQRSLQTPYPCQKLFITASGFALPPARGKCCSNLAPSKPQALCKIANMEIEEKLDILAAGKCLPPTIGRHFPVDPCVVKKAATPL